MSKPLSKDEIHRILAGRYKDEDPQTIKEISYNLALASTSEGSLNERARLALQRIKSAPQAPSPLSQQASSQTQGRLNVCPICKSSMETVKLMEDRSAHYCPDHKIVVPFPKETGGE